MTYPINQDITYAAAATISGGGGHAATYAWSFDDSATGAGSTLLKAWALAGNHTATVTATDTITSATATASKTVYVSSATWVGNTALARGWNTMTYGGGLFVAAANDNATGTGGIMVSQDGVIWTAKNSPVAANFIGSAYGNGAYVLVGTHAAVNYVVYSTDGTTWTVPTFPDKQWECIAYGNGIFVAMSWNGNPMTSPDGITWTLQSVLPKLNWKAMCYGGGKFVATNASTDVAVSTDGVNWTINTAPAGAWTGIAYGNSIFVASRNVVTSNQLMWSSDAITWNLVSFPDAGVQGYAVSFGNGWFCITPTNTGLSWGSYITQDCVTFYKINTDVSNGVWFASAYGIDRFVAVSGSTSSKRAQVLLW